MYFGQHMRFALVSILGSDKPVYSNLISHAQSMEVSEGSDPRLGFQPHLIAMYYMGESYQDYS